MRKFLGLAGVACFLSGALFASSIDSIKSKLDKLTGENHGREKAALYMDLGTLLYKDGNLAEAAQAFESALANDTSSDQRKYIYLYLGKSYESSGRPDKAITAYEEAVFYDRKNWRRYRDLGGLYEQAGLYEKAKAAYTKAQKLSPEESSLYLSLGRIWRKMGLYAYAEAWLKQALVSGGFMPSIHDELSLVYEGQGRFAEAALSCNREEPTGRLRFAYLSALSGNPSLLEESRRHLADARIKQETRQVYENLIQLLSLPPKQILAGTTGDPSLQAVLKTQYFEGTEK